MNEFIEAMNLGGPRVLTFAWPMLWQSSVLIALLFVLDLALRRKFRAAIRYSLWLLVLLKLLLPPSLALPTSLAWWVRPSAAPTVVKKPEPTFVVTYSDVLPAHVPTPAPPAFVPPPPPKPSLSAAGWAFTIWCVAGAGLFAWMLVQWWQVSRDVRRSAVAPQWLNELMDEARYSIRLSRSVQLRLTGRAMSPAVCGLFRPVILLPQSLVEKLPLVQLRAVLLHELVHLRRGDVWVNCAQAFLQIDYWWHPLLWLANAQIRRVREEAVDDAVMLALADDADAYAPTLLEVAKLAFNRPLASLGLVGILESRSALRQRIARLMDFRPPRKAGLTLAPTFCVIAFAALAAPMEKAPYKPEATASLTDSDISAGISAAQPSENITDRGTGAARLVIPILSQAQPATTNVPSLSGMTGASGKLFPASLSEATETQPVAAVLTTDGLFESAFPKSLYEQSPGPRYVGVSLYFQVEVREDGSYWASGKRMTLEELRDWVSKLKQSGPDSSIGFQVHSNAPAESVQALTQLRQELGTSPGATNAPASSPALEHLHTRVFKVDTNVFLPNLKKQAGLGETSGMESVSMAFNKALLDAGLDLRPPKSVFFTLRGGLLVRGTLADLDRIEQLIQELSYVPPQINIKAKFIELPQQVADTLWLDLLLTNSASTTNFNVLLTPAQAARALESLKAQNGVDILSTPEVTTLNGRQAQIATVELKTVVTGMKQTERTLPNVSTNGATNSIYQTESVPLGPVLDVIPHLADDGYTVGMTVIATLTEFLGYDDPGAFGPASADRGTPGVVSQPLPRFRIRQKTTTASLFDGQTMVLWNPGVTEIFKKPDGGTEAVDVSGTTRKQLLVFVMPRLVDPAGNPIHNDDEMPFMQKSIPPQPPSQK